MRLCNGLVPTHRHALLANTNIKFRLMFGWFHAASGCPSPYPGAHNDGVAMLVRFLVVWAPAARHWQFESKGCSKCKSRSKCKSQFKKKVYKIAKLSALENLKPGNNGQSSKRASMEARKEICRRMRGSLD